MRSCETGQITESTDVESSSGHPKHVGNEDVSVFDYSDYHAFLKDWVEYKRSQRTGFSFQVLANRAGLKSRSFLRKVSLGQKDLLHAAALKLAEAIGLDDREVEYFLALVGFCNAADPWERDLYRRKMRKHRKPTKRSVLSAQEFSFFSKWYVVAIWEVVTVLPFGGDFRMLANSVTPAISSEDARAAILVLLDLGLIKPHGDRYVQTRKVLHTRDSLISRAIKTYQRETIELAAGALDRFPPDQRWITTLTMGLGGERWAESIRILEECRQKLIDLGSESGDVDRVFQFNFQAFPLGVPLAENNH